MIYLLPLVPVIIIAIIIGYKRFVVWPGDPTKDKAWDIGPIIGGANRSVGMPSHPTGLAFDIPQPTVSAGHVHYVTFVHGSLKGKRRLRLRYRIEAAEDVKFFGRNNDDTAGGPGRITLHFQRRGDTWGRKPDTFRWYKVFTGEDEQVLANQLLTPGEHELVADLDGHWLGTETSRSTSDPGAFEGAKAWAGRVGFVLGGGDGWGHGVWASGPARLTILEFSVP